MVVSKDSKRKRKESSPPPQQSQQPTVESSPEMPKRTKVQAQRKFAQGQSAPQSSYSAIIAASSSSNTGPSTSSESREPPTEILPNKRPKTEDFLTFLCFRGTSALPPNLDFLNQGKSKESERPVKKTVNKINKKSGRKGRKGRPSKTKQNEKAKDTLNSTNPSSPTNDKSKEANCIATASESKNKANEEESGSVATFAVRKRAEIVADGNRRNRNANEKCNSLPDAGKRRSNRTTKDAKSKVSHLTDDEEEEVEEESTNDANSKVVGSDTEAKQQKTSKTPVPAERKSETPSKDSETTSKSRKGRPPSANKKKDFEAKETCKTTQKLEQSTLTATKEKVPVKRSRQKESPIFIPSPEPSGRMTRQRAFFEPVKVSHQNDNDQMNDVEKSVDSIKSNKKDTEGRAEKEVGIKKADEEKLGESKEIKEEINGKPKNSKSNCSSVNADKDKSNLNVFDFSSDDEQPLAKAIKIKKGNRSSLKKTTLRSTKIGKKATTITPKKSAAENKGEPKKESESAEKEDESSPKVLSSNEKEKSDEIVRSKGKRGNSDSATDSKNVKKKEEEEHSVTVDGDQAPPTSKKTVNARHPRKKSKVENNGNLVEMERDEGPERPPSPPVRSQRPSRKTKEAATIYMGIIGHRLQLADDEEDDISLGSFPDRPNVREMEKMENELKRNAAAAAKASNNSPTPKQTKTTTTEESSVSLAATALSEKPLTGRRGRPPKNQKQPVHVKREIEGMLVKKGAIAKITNATDNNISAKELKSEANKADTDEEDFLLNEEVNETKRKLEKSFSDSDDEPLAIKVNVKGNEKDEEIDSHKSTDQPDAQSPLAVTTSVAMTNLSMLPITTKSTPELTPPLPIAMMTTTAATATSVMSPTTSAPAAAAVISTPQTLSPFKSMEKKSPVPTSKILNVPATYGIPSVSPSSVSSMNANFGKSSLYLPQPAAHYHPTLVRPNATLGQFNVQPAKSPTVVAQPVTTHLTTPSSQLSTQSPMKYQTPPTTYPPPIEAYPSPKINPNFLTPKFDRTSLPRAGNNNTFPSPSPVKFDVTTANNIKSTALTTSNAIISGKNLITNMNANIAPSTALNAASTPASAAGGQASNDPLKDEIGNILAANLMPSKEESGKIFGIASVSLAQSSGPDNTKCTLGKCGSIHKPVLGPVVPTESYIGDQLSSKERRKAKVNMTHEQIQKWLIECSSNPDEIQDDLDDDFDSDLRPNNFGTTPPPTRDDKESTSFSSSSKATRDLGKSECAWSAKGPSLKATPVVANSAVNNRKEEAKMLDVSSQHETGNSDHEKATGGQAVNLTREKSSATKQSVATGNVESRTPKSDKSEKKIEKKLKEDKSFVKEQTIKETKQGKQDKEREHATTSSAKMTTVGKHSNAQQPATQRKAESPTAVTTATGAKQNRKKASSEDKIPLSGVQKDGSTGTATQIANRTPKRTPVYNQKTPTKPIELKETTTTSHKRMAPFSYGAAFSADNEKSIYSFDKDDDDVDEASKPTAYRRQSQRDSHGDTGANMSVPAVASSTPTTSHRTSPTKKRAAAAAAEKANKDLANASQSSSVSLTLSPGETTKLVKVSLDAEKIVAKPTSGKLIKATKKTAELTTPTTGADGNEVDSDSGDGHTFYIPLQGVGTGSDGEGGIQGVAVKLGREGPDGPNQKVIMHATLVTKAQMGANSKPLPDSMNVSDIVKNLMTTESNKKGSNAATAATTSPAAVATATTTTNSASNSLKNVPIGTVQPRFKGAGDTSTSTAVAGPAPTTSGASGSGGGAGGTLVRVNSSSSLFSGSAKSRAAAVGVTGAGGPTHLSGGSKKFKDSTPIKMSNNTAFPRHDDPTQMVEAPIFRPSEKEFADPIEFIERITPIAARFGICKIIPPSTFKPECRISDEMRFTAYNQYVHKMLHRWGPSAKELSAIKKYLTTQSIVMNHPPWIGGMEVDLPRLYHTVQELGGLKEVIEKKKWARVAEEMCIPKLAQDRVTKLDDIYCKYLLPYDTLSPAERQKLFDEVEADWAKREARARRNADRFVNTESVSNEEDDVSSDNDEEESEEEVDGVSMECIVKGRSMPLSQFYRIARNTMALWFKNTEPTVNEVEAEFWRHVAVRDSHVCVHAGSIDSSGWGFGFPSPGPKGKGSNYARHPWNLKVLTNNPGSVLRSLGPVMGVTVPTLHVGMLFSACCWYRDPHGLSWIEYLHTGASKLWYGIPDDQSANFRSALTSLIPTHCQNKTIWLPCDTVMVPPHMLTDRGVSLCRIEQKPGEFIVVFPRAYTSSLATGYVVSESVYFATSTWLDLAKDDFRDIHDSCEPAMFSLEQLLFALGYDQRVTSDTLQQMLPMLHEVFEKETAAREQLKAAGVTSTEKVHNEKGTKAKKHQQPPYKSIESECDLCRANLYISMVRTDEGSVYCLQHALKNLNNGNIQAKQCKLIYAYNVDDIESLIQNLKDKIQQKRNAITGKKQK